MTDTPLPSSDSPEDFTTEGSSELGETVHEARLWRDDGWTARVVDMEGHRVDRVRLLPVRAVPTARPTEVGA